MLRFYTAGESHGQALLAFISGLPASPARRRRLHQSRTASPAARLWPRRPPENRKRSRGDLRRRAPRPDHRRADRAAHRKSRLGQLGEDSSRRRLAEARRRTTKKLVAPRPGHADLAGSQKFNFHDARYILERASARETAARVAAGALAKLLLREFGTEIASHTMQVGHVKLERARQLGRNPARSTPISIPRCAASIPPSQDKMKAEVDAALKAGDTVGGIFEVVAHNVPVGLGSHAQWDEKLDGRLAQAVMSIQAVKGVEIGAGVAAAGSYGSEVQDEISYDNAAKRFRAFLQSRRRPRRRHHQRRRRDRARLPEAHFHAATRPGHRRHGHQGTCPGRLRALRLVRRPRRRRRRRSHGRPCARRCFSAKIWRRLARRDAAELRQLCPTNRRVLNRRSAPLQKPRPRSASRDGAPAAPPQRRVPQRRARSTRSSNMAIPSSKNPPQPVTNSTPNSNNSPKICSPPCTPRKAWDWPRRKSAKACAWRWSTSPAEKIPKRKSFSRILKSSTPKAKSAKKKAACPFPVFAATSSARNSSPCSAQNAKGESFEIRGEDLLARAFCHEIDHLNGILFIQHLSMLKRDLIKRKIKKLRNKASGRMPDPWRALRISFLRHAALRRSLAEASPRAARYSKSPL